ncbi:MAG: hypothetical protein ACRD4P_17975 [Bryobacteraceae bacterium]
MSRVVSEVRIGTNLDLVYLIWTLMSGRLLESRGAVIPGLSAFGLPEDAVRRSAAALTSGVFEIEPMVEQFRTVVDEEGRWEAHEHGGYRPVAVDLVGFSRPKLKGCPTKHYVSTANKAVPAIVVGIAGAVGSVGDQRLAVPRSMIESDPKDPSEKALMKAVPADVNAGLSLKEAIIVDRGFPLAAFVELEIERYVKRGRENFKARRAEIHLKGRGRHPQQGEIVRPLPRTYSGRVIEGTPCDREERWKEKTARGTTIWVRAAFWDDLVEEPGQEAFRCVVIWDPRYRRPLVLVTPLDASAQDLRRLYLDRWPIEGLPLIAKQMLGVHRQFVWGVKSRTLLPMLALLSGAILSYLGATERPVATGFWDRSPRPTAGRLRRLLARVHFRDLPLPTHELRKKQSPTAHLLKGILAHRRRKSPLNPAQDPPQNDLPLAA